MTRHYSEADLLESYYMTPEQASPLIAHVNECGECQQRYQRLAHKLREVSACPTDKPATFWARQRLMILRSIESMRQRPRRVTRVGRVAAAALLFFILGGVVVYETTPRQKPPVVLQQTAAAPATSPDDLLIPRDPWQSEELKDFGAVVQWQSWVAKSKSSDQESSL